MDLIKSIEDFICKCAEMHIEIREIGFPPEKWNYVLTQLGMCGYRVIEDYSDVLIVNTSAGEICLFKSNE